MILVKDGPNTLWLNNGENSYTGGTTVKNGLLLLTPTPSTTVGGSTVTGYGDVTVNGGTLQGTANIQGNLNINTGGGPPRLGQPARGRSRSIERLHDRATRRAR